MRCVAHTTAGQPCKRKAMVGTTVCYMHNGANSGVIDVADRRLLLAQLMARNPDRHPWEIIVDATRRFDALAQVEESILLHGDLTPEDVVDQLDRYVRALENAHKTSVAAVTTKAADNLGVAVRRRLELESKLLMLVTEAIVDGLVSSLGPVHAEAVRVWMLTVVQDRLATLEPSDVDGDFAAIEPMSPPFRLMLAPGHRGPGGHRGDHERGRRLSGRGRRDRAGAPPPRGPLGRRPLEHDRREAARPGEPRRGRAGGEGARWLALSVGCVVDRMTRRPVAKMS
jgi:hypothetical protein